MNKHITIPQALRAATSRFGFLGVLLLPLALLKILFAH